MTVHFTPRGNAVYREQRDQNPLNPMVDFGFVGGMVLVLVCAVILAIWSAPDLASWAMTWRPM